MKKIGKLKKKQKMILVIALVLVVMILVSIYTVAIRPSLSEEKVEYEPTTVQRGELDITITESGAIEYAQTSVTYDIDLDFSDEDDNDDDDEDDEEETVKYLTIDEIYKTAGQTVAAGDPLISFTQESIDSVRLLLASAVADAQVDYNDARSEYQLSCLEAETDYQTTLINSKYADSLYREEIAGISDNIAQIQAEITLRQENVEDLEEALEDAQEDYNSAYSEYVDAKELLDAFDPGDGAFLMYQEVYLKAQKAYNNALSSLENAQKNLSDNATAISNLSANLAYAKAAKEVDTTSASQEKDETNQSGENAELVYNAELESLAEDFNEAKEELDEIEERSQAFEDLVGEDGIIYASEDGLITAVNVEAGDELTNEIVMLSYVCADDLSISVDVTEEDIVSLTIGQDVDIVLTAYPEEHFVGTIESMETTATASNTNTVSYPVVIRIPGDLTRMYGGMTANVTFTVDSHEDTLYISRKALVEQDGSYYVYVKNGLQDYELQKVTVGLKNTSYAEILSGLEENDTIYIASTGA